MEYEIHNRILGRKFSCRANSHLNTAQNSKKNFLIPPNKVLFDDDYRVSKQIKGWKITSPERRLLLMSLLQHEDDDSDIDRAPKIENGIGQIAYDPSRHALSLKETISRLNKARALKDLGLKSKSEILLATRQQYIAKLNEKTIEFQNLATTIPNNTSSPRKLTRFPTEVPETDFVNITEEKGSNRMSTQCGENFSDELYRDYRQFSDDIDICSIEVLQPLKVSITTIELKSIVNDEHPKRVVGDVGLRRLKTLKSQARSGSSLHNNARQSSAFEPVNTHTKSSEPEPVPVAGYNSKALAARSTRPPKAMACYATIVNRKLISSAVTPYPDVNSQDNDQGGSSSENLHHFPEPPTMASNSLRLVTRPSSEPARTSHCAAIESLATSLC